MTSSNLVGVFIFTAIGFTTASVVVMPLSLPASVELTNESVVPKLPIPIAPLIPIPVPRYAAPTEPPIEYVIGGGIKTNDGPVTILFTRIGYDAVAGENRRLPFCSGLAIGDGFVLSAAHCVPKDFDDVQLYTGEKPDVTEEGTRVCISKSVGGDAPTSDLAIFKLENPPKALIDLKMSDVLAEAKEVEAIEKDAELYTYGYGPNASVELENGKFQNVGAGVRRRGIVRFVGIGMILNYEYSKTDDGAMIQLPKNGYTSPGDSGGPVTNTSDKVVALNRGGSTPIPMTEAEKNDPEKKKALLEKYKDPKSRPIEWGTYMSSTPLHTANRKWIEEQKENLRCPGESLASLIKGFYSFNGNYSADIFTAWLKDEADKLVTVKYHIKKKAKLDGDIRIGVQSAVENEITFAVFDTNKNELGTFRIEKKNSSYLLTWKAK